ncbi:MAG: hypothetical protein DRQ10_06840 [Candidatus Hydrothermota bacterium]|nr:MAG: hypothetical protein DRQ10_06840 [Candidatus Hydrothermae bacterium]
MEVVTMRSKILKNPAYWVMLVMSLFLAVWIYLTTPQKTVPVHLNFRGEVDGYGHKFMSTFLFTLLIAFFGVLIGYLDRIDPYRENVRRSRRALKPILNIASAFMLFMQLTFAWLIKTNSTHVDSTMFGVGLGVLFILLGNYLPAVKRNFFVGVRVPWTLASDTVWRKTHRLAGWAFILIGVWIVIVSFAGLNRLFWIIPFLIVIVYVAFIYPFMLFKKLELERE